MLETALNNEHAKSGAININSPLRIKQGLFKRELFCEKKNTLITLKAKSEVYFG